MKEILYLCSVFIKLVYRMDAKKILFIAQEISDEQKLYQVINEAMEFATQDGIQNGNRTALVFASKKNIPLFVNLTYIRE